MRSLFAQKKPTTKFPSVRVDTIKQRNSTSAKLDAAVKYTAEDSIRFDKINGIVYLYGSARVNYTDFELDADYIRLDQKNSTVFAKGVFDIKANRYRGRPILKQGADQPITTDSLLFNIYTKKGKSYGVFSEVDGGYLQAKQFKKINSTKVFLKMVFIVPVI